MLNLEPKWWVTGALGALLLVACEPTNQGYQPVQPIAYSHAVHAGANQIPCQYCHYGAEDGRWAGIPPAGVCMNCHAQVATDHPEVQKVKAAVESQTPIAWERVHFIPDHAFFSHQPHVNAGVDCQSCHGDVASMGVVRQEAPLTMGWCIDCHRQRGGESGVVETAEADTLTDCATCHH